MNTFFSFISGRSRVLLKTLKFKMQVSDKTIDIKKAFYSILIVFWLKFDVFAEHVYEENSKDFAVFNKNYQICMKLQVFLYKSKIKSTRNFVNVREDAWIWLAYWPSPPAQDQSLRLVFLRSRNYVCALISCSWKYELLLHAHYYFQWLVQTFCQHRNPGLHWKSD